QQCNTRKTKALSMAIPPPKSGPSQIHVRQAWSPKSGRGLKPAKLSRVGHSPDLYLGVALEGNAVICRNFTSDQCVLQTHSDGALRTPLLKVLLQRGHRRPDAFPPFHQHAMQFLRFLWHGFR